MNAFKVNNKDNRTASSNRNQSTDLRRNSADWFLYDDVVLVFLVLTLKASSSSSGRSI